MSSMEHPALSAVDVNAWVEAAKHDAAEHRIRRLMKIALFAVAGSPLLRDKMAVKGGVLLALQYGSNRHTKDVDFSTERLANEEDIDGIVQELDRALNAAARKLDPEVLCRVQSTEMNPARKDARFPTLRIRAGYALQGEKAYLRMVQGGRSPHIVIIDLSFNEATCITSRLALDDVHEVKAYSLFDQVAEKYRALIQQTSGRRDRVRRQDVYDIYKVIEAGYLPDPDDKAILLETMERKFSARGVPLLRGTIEEPEIAERAGRQYALLSDEIEEELPDFHAVFKVVREYYLSLPWSGR